MERIKRTFRQSHPNQREDAPGTGSRLLTASCFAQTRHSLGSICLGRWAVAAAMTSGDRLRDWQAGTRWQEISGLLDELGQADAKSIGLNFALDSCSVRRAFWGRNGGRIPRIGARMVRNGI